MNRNYSRLASVEERKNRKDAVKFITLSIIALILLIVVGVPAFARLSTFLTDFKSKGTSNGINDITPPAPPLITLPPEYTNQKTVKIEGSSEQNAVIKIKANDKTEEIQADIDGKFSYEFNLNDGENTFSAQAIDEAKNESNETKTYKIVFDNKAPEIEISSHSDRQTIYGEKNRSITLSGKTEVNSQVTINDRFVTVDSDGNFKFTNNLGDGENKFNIKVTDAASNFTEMDFFITFSPY